MVDITTLVWFVLLGLVIGIIYSWITKDEYLPRVGSISIAILAAVCGGVLFQAFNLGAPLGMAVIAAVMVMLTVHVFSAFF
ncbi:MAG: hypothetical protein WD267_05125 [Balneolales bacterium]